MTASILMSGAGMMPALSISPERLEALERQCRRASGQCCNCGGGCRD